MGHVRHFGVLDRADVYFISPHGGPVQETDHTGTRRVIRPLHRNGIAAVAVALAGVAFAAPAHAEDPSTPTPVMLGTSAVIPPDEVQAPPADVTLDVDPSAAVVPPEVQEVPAKSARAEQPDVPERVISGMQRARGTAAEASHPRAVAGWYQVPQRQYRRDRSGTRSLRTTSHAQGAPQIVNTVPSRNVSVRQTARIKRESVSQTCAGLCAADRRYKARRNGSDITTCILGRGLLCGLLLERAGVLMEHAASGATGQYQRAGTQYQSAEFNGAARRAVRADSTGWQLVGRNTQDSAAESNRRPVLARSTTAPHVRAGVVASVRAAAVPVSRSRASSGVRTSAGSAETAARRVRPGPAIVARAPTPSTSSDWFLRTLL